jgi:membrane protease YdiL (CAAX protease family)
MKQFFADCARALCYFLLYVGVQILLTIASLCIVSICYAFAGGTSQDSLLFAQELVVERPCLLLVFSLGVQLALLYGLFHARGTTLGAQADFAPLAFWKKLLCFVSGAALNFAVSFVLSQLSLPQALLESYEAQSALLTLESAPMRFLGVVIAAPLLEEITFRGLMQSRLQRVMPVFVAALLQSAVFGLMHGTPVWMAYGFVCGLVFSLARCTAKSTHASLAMHMGFNLIGFLGL